MTTTKQGRRRPSIAGLVAPIIIVVLTGVLSLGVADRFSTELQSRFQDDAEDSLKLTTINLDNYRDLLYAGRAFAVSSDAITNVEWRSFYNQQAVFERYPGVSSISYINSVPTSELKRYEALMKTNDYFGPTYALKQQSDRNLHGIARTYVSQNDLSGVLGMDLLATQSRLDVYTKAEAKGTIVASPPFKLATGYDGFFSVLPVYKDDRLDGYVLTSFRYDDLMKRLFSDESFGYRVSDVTDASKVLYDKRFSQEGNVASQTIEVGGRQWKVELSRAVDERPVGYLLPAGVMVTGLLLAATVYVFSVRPQVRQTLRKR